MENNKFTNCKSELKFFEAAIAETVTVASPTFNYKNAIIIVMIRKNRPHRVAVLAKVLLINSIEVPQLKV